MILGIDEVGRGPWAGPLVIGAVVLGDARIEGLNDSKKLSARRREQLDVLIREQAAGFGLGWVSAAEIDEIGLSESLKLATIRAVEQVKAPYHEIIIDGTINFLRETSKGGYVMTLKKADQLIPSVSAASIIAKVARDNYMAAQDEAYPGYGFVDHVGYGTAKHIAAIAKLGVTPLHRLSFAPLVKYRTTRSSNSQHSNSRHAFFAPSSMSSAKLAKAQTVSTSHEVVPKKAGKIASATRSNELDRPTTKSIGDAAEDRVVEYLVSSGHLILERNWKTKVCEIDIISRRDGVFYFTEVKYRKNSQQGGGFAAITAKKLRQMKFAAELYVLKSQMSAVDLRLAAADVSGEADDIHWTTLD